MAALEPADDHKKAEMYSFSDEPKKKEIYSYHAPWLIYGMGWSVRPDKRFRLAIGSFEEEYTNMVRIVQLDQEKQAFVETGELDHPYPTTKVMWIPDQNATHSDLLATTGDYLRLWHVAENGTPRLECLLNNVRALARRGDRRAPAGPRDVAHARARTARSRYARAPAQNKNTEFCSPLTSFDWNETDPSMIGTSSIDTTCTIWDITVREHRAPGAGVRLLLPLLSPAAIAARARRAARAEADAQDAADRARQGGVRHCLCIGRACLRLSWRGRVDAPV